MSRRISPEDHMIAALEDRITKMREALGLIAEHRATSIKWQGIAQDAIRSDNKEKKKCTL